MRLEESQSWSQLQKENLEPFWQRAAKSQQYPNGFTWFLRGLLLTVLRGQAVLSSVLWGPYNARKQIQVLRMQSRSSEQRDFLNPVILVCLMEINPPLGNVSGPGCMLGKAGLLSFKPLIPVIEEALKVLFVQVSSTKRTQS